MISSPEIRPFTGRQFLAWMVGAFALVLAVNVALAWWAISTFSGEVPHGPHPAGLRMAQVLPKPEADLGWGVTLAGAGRTLTLSVTARDGGPVAGLGVSARLARPVTDRETRPLVFADRGDGVLAADLSDAAPGQWDAIVDLRDPATGETITRSLRVLLK